MKRLIYMCEELDTLERVAAELKAHVFLRCRWSVLTGYWGALQRRGLPATPVRQRKAVVSATLNGMFWGLLVGMVAAMMLITMTELPEGSLRSVALWSLPFCFAAFGAWIGGLLGLTQDHPSIAPYLDQVSAGNFLILLHAAPEDERLMKKVMAICGARKLAEQDLGLSWQRIFPVVVSGNG